MPTGTPRVLGSGNQRGSVGTATVSETLGVSPRTALPGNPAASWTEHVLRRWGAVTSPGRQLWRWGSAGQPPAWQSARTLRGDTHSLRVFHAENSLCPCSNSPLAVWIWKHIFSRGKKLWDTVDIRIGKCFKAVIIFTLKYLIKIRFFFFIKIGSVSLENIPLPIMSTHLHIPSSLGCMWATDSLFPSG